MSLPYENARSGQNARQEIIRILRRFGCEKVGFMDEFETRSVLLAFVWRGRHIQLRASAQGWANAYLAEHPWTYRRRSNKHEYEAAALERGMVAVNSVLRDWVKGQVTAIETGIMTFEHVFMPFMLAADGKPLVEHARKLLPAQEGEESARA